MRQGQGQPATSLSPSRDRELWQYGFVQEEQAIAGSHAVRTGNRAGAGAESGVRFGRFLLASACASTVFGDRGPVGDRLPQQTIRFLAGLAFSCSSYERISITTNLLRDRRYAPRAVVLRWLLLRRSLRTFPVYFCVTSSARRSSLAQHSSVPDWSHLPTATYNLTHLRRSFVFNPWYGHFWSLCIEEQFYLVWPPVAHAATRAPSLGPPRHDRPGARLPRRGRDGVARSFAERTLAGDAVYWFTPSQMDAFAFGADRRLPGPARADNARYDVAGVGCGRRLGAWCAESLVAPRDCDGPGRGLTNFGYPLAETSHGLHVWGHSILDLSSALPVLCGAQGKLRWIDRPWLRHLGRVSYGAYVVHRAVILVAEKGLGRFVHLDTTTGRLVVLCVTIPVTRSRSRPRHSISSNVVSVGMPMPARMSGIDSAPRKQLTRSRSAPGRRYRTRGCPTRKTRPSSRDAHSR